MHEVFVQLHGGLIEEVYVDGKMICSEDITSWDSHADETYFSDDAISIIKEYLKLDVPMKQKLEIIEQLLDHAIPF